MADLLRLLVKLQKTFSIIPFNLIEHIVIGERRLAWILYWCG